MDIPKITAKEYREEYKYHCKNISSPYPFIVWKVKYIHLRQIQNSKDYSEESLKREKELCNELGY